MPFLIFQIHPGILEIIQVIQFVHLEKHLDGAWDTFGKTSLNDTFTVHEKKTFGPKKNSNFHAGVKKCHFGNFSERAGMAVPCESLAGSEKFFLV